MSYTVTLFFLLHNLTNYTYMLAQQLNLASYQLEACMAGEKSGTLVQVLIMDDHTFLKKTLNVKLAQEVIQGMLVDVRIRKLHSRIT